MLRALAALYTDRQCIAVVRNPAKFTALAGADAGIEVRPGDYDSVDSMTEALQGVRAMVLISAPAIGGLDRVALHRNAIDAARRAGVRRVVFTSVIGNGTEMQTGFAPTQRANRQTEQELAASGLQWIVARNGFYLDIDVEVMRATHATGRYESSSGDGRCGYVSIAELAFATAHLIAGDRPARQTYNLVGECITVPELTALVNEIFELNVSYCLVSDQQKLERSRADLRVLARGGEDIAQMFAGLMQGQRLGAFDVPSDFQAAAGRHCKSIREMLRELRAAG